MSHPVHQQTAWNTCKIGLKTSSAAANQLQLFGRNWWFYDATGYGKSDIQVIIGCLHFPKSTRIDGFHIVLLIDAMDFLNSLYPSLRAQTNQLYYPPVWRWPHLSAPGTGTWWKCDGVERATSVDSGICTVYNLYKKKREIISIAVMSNSYVPWQK